MACLGHEQSRGLASYFSIFHVIIVGKPGCAWCYIQCSFPHTYSPAVLSSNCDFCNLNTCRKKKMLPGGMEARLSQPWKFWMAPILHSLNGKGGLFPPQKPGFALCLSQHLTTILELIKINPGLEKGQPSWGGGTFPLCCSGKYHNAESRHLSWLVFL